MGLRLMSKAENNLGVFTFQLEGAKKAVPQNKYAAVVLVEAPVVGT